MTRTERGPARGDDPGPRLVRLSITGRATGDAVEGIRAQVEAALARGEPFAVRFDRSRMTALTPDGRQALERWEVELTPRLPAWCRAWADVYDERRAASLLRAEQRRPSAERSPYPQGVFADPAEADRWLLARLDDPPDGDPAG